jgi:hypothetical protein
MERIFINMNGLSVLNKKYEEEAKIELIVSFDFLTDR